MDYIPDYADQYAAHEARQERELARYPKCDCCEEHITDDHFYDIDGFIVCESCLKDNYRRNTSNYVD